MCRIKNLVQLQKVKNVKWNVSPLIHLFKQLTQVLIIYNIISSQNLKSYFWQVTFKKTYISCLYLIFNMSYIGIYLNLWSCLLPPYLETILIRLITPKLITIVYTRSPLSLYPVAYITSSLRFLKGNSFSTWPSSWSLHPCPCKHLASFQCFFLIEWQYHPSSWANQKS